MGVSKIGLLGLAAATILAGCQSSRFDTPTAQAPAQMRAPAPVRAAPTTSVQSTNLNDVNASQFPANPNDMNSGAQGNTQVASLPSATSVDLTPGKVAGVWNASLAGQSCKVATPQTKFGQGYRAGPLRCPGELANLSSWSVNGKQLVLYDANGGTVASLYSSADGRFDGQTSGGQPISLSR
ncbi:protease inhibitor Inh/omp19 family protein [Pseudochrobactrum sp. MP213Fo]|uniref:protease inhibitor Inh/omp19 family protein n=1 Tax=Pseudochrobactrum sp. MP213Fo TaxID=3022250 RepID=UPI003B9E2475